MLRTGGAQSDDSGDSDGEGGPKRGREEQGEDGLEEGAGAAKAARRSRRRGTQPREGKAARLARRAAREAALRDSQAPGGALQPPPPLQPPSQHPPPQQPPSQQPPPQAADGRDGGAALARLRGEVEAGRLDAAHDLCALRGGAALISPFLQQLCERHNWRAVAHYARRFVDALERLSEGRGWTELVWLRDAVAALAATRHYELALRAVSWRGAEPLPRDAGAVLALALERGHAAELQQLAAAAPPAARAAALAHLAGCAGCAAAVRDADAGAAPALLAAGAALAEGVPLLPPPPPPPPGAASAGQLAQARVWAECERETRAALALLEDALRPLAGCQLTVFGSRAVPQLCSHDSDLDVSCAWPGAVGDVVALLEQACQRGAEARASPERGRLVGPVTVLASIGSREESRPLVRFAVALPAALAHIAPLKVDLSLGNAAALRNTAWLTRVCASCAACTAALRGLRASPQDADSSAGSGKQHGADRSHHLSRWGLTVLAAAALKRRCAAFSCACDVQGKYAAPMAPTAPAAAAPSEGACSSSLAALLREIAILLAAAARLDDAVISPRRFPVLEGKRLGMWALEDPTEDGRNLAASLSRLAQSQMLLRALARAALLENQACMQDVC
jgi:hypothetical protein